MPEPPLVVLDTNVLEVSMRSRRGASFAVVSRLGNGDFNVAISVPLVLEYEEVLLRQATELGRTAESVRDLIDYVCRIGKRQEIFFLWRPWLPDPDDDMLLELAVAAECEAIVTHNRRDFRSVSHFGIAVLSPAEFLNRIGTES